VTTRTLRCFAMPARPFTICATTLSLCARSLSTSIFGVPCFASVSTSAACSSAFDGMQPTLRQTPPSDG
jgi:hypothetical protein